MLLAIASLLVPLLFWGGLIVVFFSLVHGLGMMAFAIIIMVAIDRIFGWRR